MPPRANGRKTRASHLQETLLLAIAELTNAERAEDLVEASERCGRARGFIAEALEQAQRLEVEVARLRPKDGAC